jgi:ornithine cyclodeaminase
MRILNANDVRMALPMREAIEGMKRAFADLSAGQAEVPLRGRLRIAPHDGLAIFMPAFVDHLDGQALALKVVSLFPGNPSRGLAYIQAAVLVLDPETGRLVGLLEGSALTAIRTGAASGAAIDLLSRPESHCLAVFGAGAQGRTQIEAACSVREIRTVWIYDPVHENSGRLAEELSGLGPIPRDLRVAGSADEAASEADVICTATTSITPVLPDASVRDGTHISAVGSYTPDMQEISTETVLRARVIVDSRSAALAETGDLIQPIRAGRMVPEHIAAELGEIVLGRAHGRQSALEITLFKSVGVAVQDAVASDMALRNAMRLGLGQEVVF